MLTWRKYPCTCLPCTHHAHTSWLLRATQRLWTQGWLFLVCTEEGWAGSMIPSHWPTDLVQLLKLSAVQGKIKEKMRRERASSDFCQRAQWDTDPEWMSFQLDIMRPLFYEICSYMSFILWNDSRRWVVCLLGWFQYTFWAEHKAGNTVVSS